MKSRSHFLSGPSGFSLVEMIVVIAIIGIITAAFMPGIYNVSSQATAAKDQRNAQTIASTVSAAVAAGYSTTNFVDSDQTIALLTAGITVTNLSGDVMRFEISPLSANEQAGAKNFLLVTNGAVIQVANE